MNAAIHGGLPWKAIYAELYGAFPQRYLTGVAPPPTTQESPLGSKTFTGVDGRGLTVSSLYGKTNISTSSYLGASIDHKDTPALALEVLTQDSLNRLPRHLASLNTISVGYDDVEGRVYVPKDDQQAQRNLNFALANLAAYERYQNIVKPEQAAEAKKKAEALKALREEAKRKEEAEAKRREELNIERKALKIYNAASGSGYGTWPTFMGQNSKDKWIALAKQAEVIKTTAPTPSYPDTSLYARGGHSLYPSVFDSASLRKAFGI